MISDQLLSKMRATNALFCTEVAGKRNLAALDQIYTKHARILPPGSEMISGRDNIKTFWGSAFEAMSVASASLETVEAELLGDRILEIGRATLVTPDGSAAVKYVVQWAQEDGQWKWAVDIWNS
jgi:ketosteroid isomerase-like protein